MQESLAKIAQVGVKLELDDPPTREEIRKATMQTKVGKSPGIDGIPAEVYQHGGEAVLGKPHDLFAERTSTAGLKGLQSLSLCTKTREKDQTVQTIDASPYSPLQANSWLASC